LFKNKTKQKHLKEGKEDNVHIYPMSILMGTLSQKQLVGINNPTTDDLIQCPLNTP